MSALEKLVLAAAVGMSAAEKRVSAAEKKVRSAVEACLVVGLVLEVLDLVPFGLRRAHAANAILPGWDILSSNGHAHSNSNNRTHFLANIGLVVGPHCTVVDCRHLAYPLEVGWVDCRPSFALVPGKRSGERLEAGNSNCRVVRAAWPAWNCNTRPVA